MLPLEFPGLLKETGFGSLNRKNLSYVDTSLHNGAPGFYLSKLMALFAQEQGVAKDDTQKWLAQLDEADKKQRCGFVNFPLLTVATAIKKNLDQSLIPRTAFPFRLFCSHSNGSVDLVSINFIQTEIARDINAFLQCRALK